MRVPLILLWITVVSGTAQQAVRHQHPNTFDSTAESRILQGSTFHYAARSSGHNGHLRQQVDPTDPFAHTARDDDYVTAAHVEASHMHPYIEEGRPGQYSYAGKSSKKEGSSSNMDDYMAQGDDFYVAETSGRSSKKSKGSKSSKARGHEKKQKNAKCKWQ